MGQAFDKDGAILGEAYGDTKRAVFDKLMTEHEDGYQSFSPADVFEAGYDRIV